MSRLVRRCLVGLVVLAVVAGGVVALDRFVLDRDGTRLSAMFEATVGLYPGSDVQVLGVPVGTVTKIVPEGDEVRVEMALDPGQEVAADTGAVLVAPTLVSDRFVQLTEPYDGGDKLASGTRIPADRTAVPVEIDDLYASLTDISDKLGPDGANRNGALSRLLEAGAANLDGNGRDLNTMFAELSKATATLNDADDQFFETVSNLKGFNDMLVANDQGVAHVNQQLATVAEYLADDREDLAAAVDNLGDALSVVDDFIRDNRGSLKRSVDNLTGPTQVLVKQKKSLEESVRLIPLVLQNFLRAYNPSTNTLDGRGNLNELTLWSDDGLSGRTSEDAPPTLLPGTTGDER